MAMTDQSKVPEPVLGDRLSSLPDEIIAHILSFLETKYAVGTAVLSRRWKDLWTRVSNLDFDECLGYRDRLSPVNVDYLELFEVLKRNHLDFSRFVDRVLSLHRNLDSLRRFRFQFMTWDADCNVMQDFVDKMGLVFGSQLEEIDMKLMIVRPVEPWRLPGSFYTMKNLKVAKLDGFTMTEKGNDSVSLPCLKILQLRRVETKDFESLGKLFSGCPVLESLRLQFLSSEDSNQNDILTASLPSLRNLTIVDSREADINCLCHIAMEAPNLEHLCLDHFTGLELLGSSPLPCLHSAEIKPDEGGDSYQGLIRLLTRISNAKKMCLDEDALEVLSSGGEDVQLPVFPNLTHLEVEPSSRSWILHSLLHSAPKLQSLVVDVGWADGFMWEETEPTCPPECLLSSLEEIQIKGFGPFDSDMKMAGDLLNVGAVLKKVDIGLFDDPTKEQRKELQSLLKLPRESGACYVRLLLHGREIDVSIDDDEINTDNKDEIDLNNKDEDRF